VCETIKKELYLALSINLHQLLKKKLTRLPRLAFRVFHPFCICFDCFPCDVGNVCVMKSSEGTGSENEK
jgi:hypothetical protein